MVTTICILSILCFIQFCFFIRSITKTEYYVCETIIYKTTETEDNHQLSYYFFVITDIRSNIQVRKIRVTELAYSRLEVADYITISKY